MVRTAKENGSPRCTSASDRRSSVRLFVLLCGCITFAGGPAVAWTGQAEALDQILAIVAGHVILQSDVRAFVDLQLPAADNGVGGGSQDDVLTYLIERRLVLDEVDRYVAADPPPAGVERRMAAVAERFPSEAAFEAALARVGFSRDDLLQVLRDDLRLEVYLENRFGAVPAPSEEQLRAYYDERRDEFVEGGRPLPFGEARPFVLRSYAEEHRAALVGEWVEGLVRRGQVNRLPPAGNQP
ncbi:MAG: hypothetical protein J4F30_00720 [Acidobacteria bacterium]|nr:hypothetical protein [Acidobacteriota bacterium]